MSYIDSGSLLVHIHILQVKPIRNERRRRREGKEALQVPHKPFRGRTGPDSLTEYDEAERAAGRLYLSNYFKLNPRHRYLKILRIHLSELLGLRDAPKRPSRCISPLFPRAPLIHGLPNQTIIRCRTSIPWSSGTACRISDPNYLIGTTFMDLKPLDAGRSDCQRHRIHPFS